MVYYKLSLCKRDAEALQQIAIDLDISECEVIRKGLQLMALYWKIKELPDCALLWRSPDGQDYKLV